MRMPGIFGLATNSCTFTLEKQLYKMQNAMTLYTHFVQDSLFANEHVAASRVHLGKIGEENSPIALGELIIWVEGEVYNLHEVSRQLGGLTATSIGYFLLDAEKQGRLNQVLNKLDGYFCAALYNAATGKIKLISDRYGMRVLYWYFKDGLFAWGSAVKAILAMEGIDKTLDQSSYECFMDLGYLMGERTWFEQVKLIKPATILEYDLEQNKVSQEYYWSWAEITPSNLSFEEAVDKLGELFIEAVAKRFNPEEKIGITLSGGLDSRAIFAVINLLYPDYKGDAFTFGVPNCDDILIAKECVNRTKGWQHHCLYFDNTNWFEPRFPKVWDTDGLLNIMHMHGSEFLDYMFNYMHINLNGYAGDAVLGGSLISRNTLFQDKKPSKENAELIYGKHAIQYDDEFFNIEHFDHYLYMNRVRRFTNGGSINALVAVEQRKPFFDNKVIELIFSLPDSYRVNNKLYSAMLQNFFPKFFLDIPWQKTRLNLDGTESDFLPKTNVFRNYMDYSTTINIPEVYCQLYEMLNFKNSRYKLLTNNDAVKEYLKSGESDLPANYIEKICRTLTIELYLRNVFIGN